MIFRPSSDDDMELQTLSREVLGDLFSSFWKTKKPVENLNAIQRTSTLDRRTVEPQTLRRQLLSLFDDCDACGLAAPLAMTVVRGADFGPMLLLYTVLSTSESMLPGIQTAINHVLTRIDRTVLRGTVVGLTFVVRDHTTSNNNNNNNSAAIRRALQRKVCPSCDILVRKSLYFVLKIVFILENSKFRSSCMLHEHRCDSLLRLHSSISTMISCADSH